MARADADMVIEATGARIKHKGRTAFYTYPFGNGHGDYITVPPKHMFLNEDYYYQVVFHELAHYCEPRLGDMGNRELNEQVADFVAYLICCALDIPFCWDGQKNEFTNEIAKKAKEVADFILSGCPSACTIAA
jgi:hypothetical protein